MILKSNNFFLVLILLIGSASKPNFGQDFHRVILKINWFWKAFFLIKGLNLLIGFPNNKSPPQYLNYLPCLVIGGETFSIRRKGLLPSSSTNHRHVVATYRNIQNIENQYFPCISLFPHSVYPYPVLVPVALPPQPPPIAVPIGFLQQKHYIDVFITKFLLFNKSDKTFFFGSKILDLNLTETR